MGLEIKRSVCPYDCPDACGLLVHVDGGRAVKVSGDPDHPFTRGALCPKMVNYERTVHSPRRLTRPLIRIGPKGRGEFRPATWEEAIERIATRWQDIIRRWGSEAILPCSYAGTMGLVQRHAGFPFFHRLGASRLERTLCSPAKDYGWKAVMGSTLAPHPDEAAASDLIILWGVSAVATNIHFLHAVRQARAAGAKVWAINTYADRTARLADRFIAVRPGSDGALALGMMHVIAADGLADTAFLAAHVQGYPEFAAKILPEYPPEKVNALTGIPAEEIVDLARAYAAARAPFIRLGSGLSRYGNGAMTVRAIVCLPAVTGAWAKAGGGLLASVATGGAFDMARITREDLLPRPVRTININQVGSALTTLDGPPVMSFYVYSNNPAVVLPDQNAVLKGLSREDLFTVVHERFLTDTAKYADVVLPATSSLEHTDLYRSYGHYCVQLAHPAIPPVGEAKSNWDVFRLLADALGFGSEPFFNRTTEEVVDSLLEAPGPWLAKADLAALRAGRPVELPLPPDYKMQFGTPSGKIEILNPAEAEPFPRYLAPHGDPEPLWFMSAPTPYLLNSSFSERPDLVAKAPVELMMNPADAAARNLTDGQTVAAVNRRGRVLFRLRVTPGVPAGVVVSEGVHWLDDSPGGRSVNALTAQRLTDRAAASTFYDVKVEVLAAAGD